MPNLNLNISTVRAVFGPRSQLTKTARYLDNNSGALASAPGARVNIQPANGVIEGQEWALIDDAFFPTAMRKSAEKLYRLGNDARDLSVWSPPAASGNFSLEETSSKMVTPKQLPVAMFRGTALEAAVKAMVAQQAQKTMLLRSTVESAQNSVLFSARFPGAATKVADQFNANRTYEKPPANISKRIVDLRDFSVTTSRTNKFDAVGNVTHATTGFTLQTVPNAVVTADVYRPNSWGGWNESSEEKGLFRADAQGKLKLPEGTDEFMVVVHAYSPDAAKMIGEARVLATPGKMSTRTEP